MSQLNFPLIFLQVQVLSARQFITVVIHSCRKGELRRKQFTQGSYKGQVCSRAITVLCCTRQSVQPSLYFLFFPRQTIKYEINICLNLLPFSNPCFASLTSQALHLIHLASRPWFFHAPSNQCNLLFIFCFFQKKQLSLTETIKYEVNKYMFKFIILKFFCCREVTNLTESKSRRRTPLVTSAVLKPNYSSGTIRT